MAAGVSKLARRRGSVAELLAFSAFLSHRYRSPIVNRFFFRLFAEEAQIQFSVDKGSSAATGIVAYLHGRFVPSLRLLHIPDRADAPVVSMLPQTLYGAHSLWRS
jgi:hypothetical protein